ncbi:MAG: TetR family transcriptional regulator [Caulobacter sp.]|nr:TetR family transcriptional regulator [Caulobacter sp.]
MDLIARAGLDGVTVRDVALAAGYSTAVVSHYFHNKKELLFLTYRGSIDRASERSDRAVAEDGGANLKGYLCEIMPLDDVRLTEWKIWLAFWGKAVTDEEIAAEQRECVRSTRAKILGILDQVHDRGDLVAGVDREHVARHVLALITGMAIEVMFDAEDWPAERQHELVDRELRVIYQQSRLPRSVASGPAARAPNRLAAAAG